MIYILNFFLGSAVASFAFCFANDWVHHKISLTRRSACDDCGHFLGVADLIPIVSQLFAGFRCRYCLQKTSFYYIIVEFSAGLQFIWLLILFPDVSIYFILLFHLIHLLMIYSDIHAYFVPDVLQVILLMLIFNLLSHLQLNIWGQLFNLCFIGSLLFALFLLRPNWFGGADVKTISILSLLIPPIYLPTFLFYSSLSGLIFLCLYRLTKGTQLYKLPFLPFIFFAFFVTLTLTLKF